FLTPTQVSTTFLYAAPLALLAAGQTLVMLTGGVDLSVATSATTAAFVSSGTAHDHGTGYALLLALAFGFGIGLVNGIGVAIFRVNPLIVTLGISSVTLGALTIYSQTRFVALVPNIVNTLGSSRFFKYVPYDLLVWAPIAALIILGLRFSGFGRMIFAVGDNPVACRLAGVRVWQVLLLVYALCGAFSAVAGILLVRFAAASTPEVTSLRTRPHNTVRYGEFQLFVLKPTRVQHWRRVFTHGTRADARGVHWVPDQAGGRSQLRSSAGT